MVKKIVMGALLVIGVFFSFFISAMDTIPPKVIATNPENGKVTVDPFLKEISITFNEPMLNGGWSWSYDDKSKFPEITGDPYYKDDFTICTLPVKLEANKEYVIWINTQTFMNFKDVAGNSALPFQFSFKTK